MKRLVVVVGVTIALWFSADLAASGVSAQTTAKGAQAVDAKGTRPLKPEELDQLLAPVALYPDALLANILMCASNPGKVGTLEEWLRSQGSLTGSALQDAAKAAGFEDSFVAIVIFPDVVSMMATKAEWTAALGRAFTADRSAVFASIQRLRTKATQAGTLKDSPQQNVETRTTSSGEQVTVIEPANPQIVYVPQYNPQTVYAPTTTTVVVQEDDDDGAAVAAGVIGFTAGIALGAAIDNDYYYGPYGWGGGAYMYNDAWDDWYDDREDAREDWADHREDMYEDRSERAEDAREERGERAETRSENRPETQAERTERQQTRQQNRSPEAQAQLEQRRTEGASAQSASTARTSAESRGYSGSGERQRAERSGTKSDAFSGYSSGRSERAASSRGQRSRSSSRGGGGRRR